MRYACACVACLLVAAAANAEVKTKSISYADGDQKLVGFLAWDDAIKGKRPGVLICHQWMGLGEHEMRVARELAKLGYVAFALDIYGPDHMPTNRKEAGAIAGEYRGDDRTPLRNRAKAGLETLRAQKHVDTGRIAAIGYCFGGTTVLELARSGADVDGVVSFHGGLGTPKPEDAKHIKAKVLVCHGAVDPYVPDEEVQGFLDEMNAADVDYQFIAYANAVHAFTDERLKGAEGGASYHAAADRRSWGHMKLFFEEIFLTEEVDADAQGKSPTTQPVSGD